MRYFYNILIALAITIVSTAALTFFLSLRFEKEEKDVEVKNAKFVAPVDGEAHPLKDAFDEAFASEMMGKGAMIKPSSDLVVAPFDGTVATLFPTKHAIGVVSKDGVECLIHIGIDTVNLNGTYFDAYVKQGDAVKAGQKLVKFDRKAIEKAGYKTETMVIVTNSANYGSVSLVKSGNVKAGEELIEVR